MSDTSSDPENEQFGEGATGAREETSESEEQEEREQETTDFFRKLFWDGASEEV